ncbi:MAG: MurR/RpiR family transcriptional regulator [Ruminococcaceae bacterium]|nr:MurR/RpiR family transcriptional regulator [Oscillospiraceae bacterium]
MSENLFKVIESKMSDFSKGQRLIAKYILENYDKAAYMTASKLGTTVGISESTVVRFAMEIGFAGYPEFLKELQSTIKNKLTAVQRIEVAKSRIDENDVLSGVLNSDIEKIRLTLENIDKETFSTAVKSIISAKRIYIIGVRSSAPLAAFIDFYFNLIFENVKLVNTASASEMFEQMLRVSKDDVVIGISFPRYSKRTVKAMQFANDNGANVIAITDTENSPMCQYANTVLAARSDMVSFVDSLVAPLSLINSLIVAISMAKKEDVSLSFEKLENVWDEYDVYEKLNNE